MRAMELYLDANATTPVLPQARAAALAAMAEEYGNPSSTHGSGLRARALLDRVRDTARRVLAVPTGELLFTSGATEGIQTAVLSALVALRQREAAGQALPRRLLYGATEHKAVPSALRHWNALLGLDLDVQAIPVDREGRHDLAWLRTQAQDAGLVCTMAANNETGVVSDLDGIAAALAGSPALWLVDGVQALGKLPLKLVERRIDYAPFSGHKLYAPKGIGLLYVREGAPLTPLQAGGGQEGGLRAGTENMAGIAALGAVLEALASGTVFAPAPVLEARRQQLVAALREAFPGIVFNTPLGNSLPTTLNFSVPGVATARLLELFDAEGLRLSGGSACGAAQAQPSPVLQAMGLPAAQTTSAIRLSFGAADDAALTDEACARLRACGARLREEPEPVEVDLPIESLGGLLRAMPQARLIDVRDADERAAEPVPAGFAAEWPAMRAVPLPSLPALLAELRALPADTPVVFVCRSGARSARAARALRQQGHAAAWSLAGGLDRVAAAEAAASA